MAGYWLMVIHRCFRPMNKEAWCIGAGIRCGRAQDAGRDDQRQRHFFELLRACETNGAGSNKRISAIGVLLSKTSTVTEPDTAIMDPFL
jgi:hypothetical protein